MKRTVLSQNTLVPLSLVMAVFGGAYKFAQVSLATEVNKAGIADVTTTVKEMQKSVMVSLSDQSANVNEMRTQLMILDSKFNALAETLKTFHADERRLKRRGD